MEKLFDERVCSAHLRLIDRLSRAVAEEGPGMLCFKPTIVDRLGSIGGRVKPAQQAAALQASAHAAAPPSNQCTH